MLKIGIKDPRNKPSSGFSLIEIMVAVCVLSIGTVLVLQSNMMSLNVFGRYLNRLEVIRWADNKITQVKEEITKSDVPETGTSNGSTKTNRKAYDWQMDIETGDLPGVYSIHLDVSWPEEGRTAHVYRDSYVLKIKR